MRTSLGDTVLKVMAKISFLIEELSISLHLLDGIMIDSDQHSRRR